MQGKRGCNGHIKEGRDRERGRQISWLDKYMIVLICYTVGVSDLYHGWIL